MERLNLSNKKWHLGLLVTNILLTTCDYYSLRIIDKLMSSYVYGYKSPDQYFAAVTIFFFISYIVIYRGTLFGWKRILPYVLYGTAVFFPLIVLVSIGRFLLGLPEGLDQFYRHDYCVAVNSAGVCGQALAHMVFCMTMRTLPVLVIIPLTFYSLMRVNFMGICRPYDHSR